MFCAYCGKTLEKNADTCPFCGMPVGESHFDGSPYTSAQPKMRPGQELTHQAPRVNAAPVDEETAFTRTTYRSNSETEDDVPETEEMPKTQMSETDELLQPEAETDLDAFNPRPIEVPDQAGISEDVSEIIQRMETEPQHRFIRRKKVDYDDYENNAEEETPTAPTGVAPSEGNDGAFEDIADDEEMEELRSGGFGIKQVLRIAVALVIDAAIFIGVVSWVRYIRSNQSNSPIENVSETVYDEGIALIEQHASEENRTEVLKAYTDGGNSLTALMSALDTKSAEVTALLTDEATDNEKLFNQALTKIEANIANCITSDALAVSNKDETAVAESNERWQVVDNSITMLKAAKSATELTAIINGEEVAVVEAEPEATPTPTPAPNYNTLSKGDKSNEVLEMQNRLWELGFLQDDRDGNFGSKTQTAVKMFQQQAGIAITGIADSATLELLYSDDAPRTDAAQVTPTPAPAATESTETTETTEPADTTQDSTGATE